MLVSTDPEPLAAGEQSPGKLRAVIAKISADGLLDPDAIAETYCQLYLQPRSEWTNELDCRPYEEAYR